MKKRGRPVGWRKPKAKRWSIMIRLTREMRAWLGRESRAAGITRSEICRQLIEREMSVDTLAKRRQKIS